VEMETIALIAVSLLALLVFALCGAVLEMFKDIRQLRDIGGILDRPLDVDVASVAGKPPSHFGLPSELDAATAIVLFLSTKCATCRAIASSFDRSVTSLPAGLWIVVEGRNQAEVLEFLDTSPLKRFRSGGRVLIDVAGDIARRIGLNTTPVGFRVENGQLASATTVPSSRYLRSILPKPVSLKLASDPKEVKHEYA
jgi:hypothetical protein